MDGTTLKIIEIFLGILSATIAIIGLKAVIMPFINLRRENQIKKLQNRIDELETEASKIINQLMVFSSKINFTADFHLENNLQKDNYKHQNNLGINYLKKSRLIADEKLKKHYIKKAIDSFELSIKCFCKQNKFLLGAPAGLDQIYVNLADAYDDYSDTPKALKYCNLALVINQNCEQAYNMRASIHLDSKDLEQAETDVKESLRLNSSNGFSHLTLAEIFIEKDYVENKIRIKNLIEAALANGCPVWEYIDRKIYDELKEDKKTWLPLKSKIENYKEINKIAGICLQSEMEYII